MPDVSTLLGRNIPDAPELEPKAEQERLLAVILGLLSRQQRPLVIILEDLQWAGQESLVLLARMMEITTGLPLLILGNYRDDERPDLPEALPGIHLMKLQRLSAQSTADLSVSMLGQIGRQPALLQFLQRETEGNVFFMIEVVRTLAQEAGQLDRIGTIPLPEKVFAGGMQRLIQQRLHGVPTAYSPLLQLAAVAGRNLDRDLLQSLAPDLDLDTWLTTCANAAVLEVQENRWRFAHDKLREGLLDALLPNERQTLHRQIGQAIETVYPEAPEQAAALAYHWGIAGDIEREARYTARAGDAAFRLYALEEALVHYRRALDCAKQANADEQTLTYLYARLGRTLELQANLELALDAYDEMESWAHQHDDPAMELVSLVARATIRASANRAHNAVEGKRLLDRARVLSQMLGDKTAEAKILWNLMLLNNLTGGDLQERLEQGEQAMAMARELHLDELLAFLLLDMWYTYGGAGNWSRGLESLRESAVLWRQMGNLPMLSESLNRTSITHMFIGNFEQAQTIGEEAFQVGRTSNNIDAQANSRNMVGWTYVEQGNMAAAQQLISEGIRLGEPTGNVSVLMFARADLGFIYAMLGAFERGIALAEAARALSESKIPVMQSWPAGILIRIYLLKGDVAAAASLAQKLGDYTLHRQQVRFMVPAWAQLGLGEAELAFTQHDYTSSLLKIDSLIEHLREDGLDLFLPDALYTKGRTLLAQGMDRLENARVVLREAQVKAEQIGSQRMLWPILASLSEIESRLGHKDHAQRLAHQAAEIVSTIADQAGSPELRTSFLALPAVQRVLAGILAQE